MVDGTGVGSASLMWFGASPPRSVDVCEGVGDGGGEGSKCGSAVVAFEDILTAKSSPDGKGGLEESRPNTGTHESIWLFKLSQPSVTAKREVTSHSYSLAKLLRQFTQPIRVMLISSSPQMLE